MSNDKHFEDGRARLKRIYEYQKKGQIQDPNRAASLANSVINNIRNTNGEKAVKEVERELRSQKLM